MASADQGGSEFKAQFDQACRDLNVRHTRIKPRHAWTNGFVKRLQGTILHEHWRIAFRRRYFRRRHQLQASLDSFLEFYNFERPHQGSYAGSGEKRGRTVDGWARTLAFKGPKWGMRDPTLVGPQGRHVL